MIDMMVIIKKRGLQDWGGGGNEGSTALLNLLSVCVCVGVRVCASADPSLFLSFRRWMFSIFVYVYQCMSVSIMAGDKLLGHNSSFVASTEKGAVRLGRVS